METIRYCRVSKQEDIARIMINQDMNAEQIREKVARRMGLLSNLIDIVSLEYGCVYTDDDYVNARKTIEIIQHPADRCVPIGMRTSLPDVIYADPDEPRVQMICGHAITAENLYRYATIELKGGKSDIKCCKCSSTWSFNEVANKSQMTVDEKIFWGARITLNLIRKDEQYAECPKCRSFCQRIDISIDWVRCLMCQKNGTTFDFCWKCKKDWEPRHQCFSKGELRRMLNNCEKKIMGYSNIPNVPSLRLCPTCGALVEHIDACKQTPCKRCKTSFCFACLTICKDNRLQCSSYSSPCNVAPVQTL